MKNVNKSNSLIDCSLHWVSQTAEFSMKFENWSKYFNQVPYPTEFELLSNIKNHNLKLTFFVRFKLESNF